MTELFSTSTIFDAFAKYALSSQLGDICHCHLDVCDKRDMQQCATVNKSDICINPNDLIEIVNLFIFQVEPHQLLSLLHDDIC